jgi:hypothetical protein
MLRDRSDQSDRVNEPEPILQVAARSYEEYLMIVVGFFEEEG